jgi:hypothetical protein
MKALRSIGGLLFAATFFIGWIIAAHLESVVLNRQTRIIDANAGLVSPIEMKNATFYVTPKEAQIYHYDHLVMGVCVIIIMIAVGISAIRRFDNPKNDTGL